MVSSSDLSNVEEDDVSCADDSFNEVDSADSIDSNMSESSVTELTDLSISMSSPAASSQPGT